MELNLNAPAIRALAIAAVEEFGLEDKVPNARAKKAELIEFVEFLCAERDLMLNEEGTALIKRETAPARPRGNGRSAAPSEARRPTAKALDRAYLLTQSNDLGKARSQLGNEEEVKRAVKKWVRWFGSDSITVDKEAGTLDLDPAAVQAVRDAYAARGEGGVSPFRTRRAATGPCAGIHVAAGGSCPPAVGLRPLRRRFRVR